MSLATVHLTDMEIVARFARCTSCCAPLVDPFPPKWLIVMTGRLRSATITLHLPACSSIRNGGEP